MSKNNVNNFVPFEKLSKKEQKKINAQKRADSFGMSMVTVVDRDRSKYNRNDYKKEVRRHGYDA